MRCNAASCGAGISDPKATACPYCQTAFAGPRKVIVKVVRTGGGFPGPKPLAILFGVIIAGLFGLRYAARRSAESTVRAAVQSSRKAMDEGMARSSRIPGRSLKGLEP